MSIPSGLCLLASCPPGRYNRWLREVLAHCVLTDSDASIVLAKFITGCGSEWVGAQQTEWSGTSDREQSVHGSERIGASFVVLSLSLSSSLFCRCHYRRRNGRRPCRNLRHPCHRRNHRRSIACIPMCSGILHILNNTPIRSHFIGQTSCQLHSLDLDLVGQVIGSCRGHHG